MTPSPLIFFGTTNLDLCFNVERLPTPGESLIGSLIRNPGGKGANQAVAAAKLGLRPKFFTRVGDDDAGQILMQSLLAADVRPDAIQIAKGEISGSAMVMVSDDGGNMVVVDPGANANGLASKIGLDPKGLEATVAEHNEHARTGVDPYFQRGESAFNRTLGDPSAGRANPNLGPIKTGPFIALRIVPATLGTATGLATDTFSRVLDAQGKPIEGLFACGNDQTSIMRGIYPGAGITIGPGIVFAYRAVKAIRERQVRSQVRTGGAAGRARDDFL